MANSPNLQKTTTAYVSPVNITALTDTMFDLFLNKLSTTGFRVIRYSQYERLINIPDQLIPDFTVYTSKEKPVYIEFWGLLDDPEYVARKNRKCEIYARYRFPMIELHRHELQNLDFYMTQKLGAAGVSLGRR